jgi:hypothetical protein
MCIQVAELRLFLKMMIMRRETLHLSWLIMKIRGAVTETIRRGLRIAFSLQMLLIMKHLILLKM